MVYEFINRVWTLGKKIQKRLANSEEYYYQLLSILSRVTVHVMSNHKNTNVFQIKEQLFPFQISKKRP